MTPCDKYKPVGRLAPSPTGFLHIGNIRSFLLGWLDIRSRNGVLKLRVEDLDKARISFQRTQDLVDDLAWLGIDFDDEIVVQSERFPIYEDAIKTLLKKGFAYPCTCTRKEIELAASAPHLSDGAQVYPKTCLNRYKDIEEAALVSGRSPAVRFKMPCKKICFQDGFCGDSFYDGAELSDFPICKADGTPAYQLAVVIDDSAMGVTEVLRGDDLLESTARQLALFEAFGMSPPLYKHVPLVVDPKGRRLAKRKNSVCLNQLRVGNINPQEVVGWLGWKSGLLNSFIPCTPYELLEEYDLSKLSKNPLVWDGSFNK